MEGHSPADRDAGSPSYRSATPTRLGTFQAPLPAILLVLGEPARYRREFELATPTRRRTPP